jgi:hypothetical protein
MHSTIKSILLALPVVLFTSFSHADTQQLEIRKLPLTFPNTGMVIVNGNRINKDIYLDTLTHVKQLLTPEIGSVELKNGTLMIKDKSEPLNEIASYIDSVNEEMSKEVSIHVVFYKLTRTKAAGQSGNISNNAVQAGDRQMPHINFLIVDSLPQYLKEFTAESALTKLSDTTSLTTNSNPAIFSQQSTQKYVSGVNHEYKEGVDRTSVETKDFTWGTNIVAIPTASPISGKIQLTLNTTVTETPEFKTEKIGDDKIQLPLSREKSATQTISLQKNQFILMRNLGYVNTDEEIIAVIKPSVI